MLLTAHCRWLAAFPLLVSHAASLTAWNVTARNLVRQLWMSSIIVDNWLYVEGGEYYLVGASSYADLRHPPTRSIDLSKSWTASTLVVNQVQKPANISGGGTIGHPGLFWQESTRSILMFGGNIYTPPSRFAIWGLKVGNQADGDGTWSEVYSTTDSLWQRITWPSLASFAYSPTGGYALGGHTVDKNGVDTTMLLEMTVVNTSTKTFERQSNIGVFQTTGGVDQADGHFVPAFGGLVIFIGGIAYDTDVVGASLRSMSEITVYDPKTKKWYTQSASGDVPSGRKNFCITGAQGTNGSTYEIFVHGGSGLEFFSAANADSRNVYILTLPAFRWIRTTAQTSPRSGSTCQVVKNQMISYGGFDPTGLASFSKTDPWTYGIGVFDLTALTWGSDYNANANSYVQSNLVDRFYASNSLYPAWDDNSLAALFSVSKPLSSSTATNGPASATSSSPSAVDTTSAPGSNVSTLPAAPSDSSKPPIAAIAGGTIAGVVGLAVIFLLFWFFRLRPAKKEKKEKERLARDQNAGIAELHNNHTYPELSTERTPEMEGVSGGTHYYLDAQKKDAPLKQGPFEVPG